MSNKIIIKNGAGAPPSDTLAVAELGYDKSGKKLYSGNGEGIEATCINPFDIDFDDVNSGIPNAINADTLDGKPASEYATITQMNTQIEAALVQLHNQIITGAW